MCPIDSISLLLIGNVTSISCFTLATFGEGLENSVFNTLLWRSKDAASSPGGTSGNPNALTVGVFWMGDLKFLVAGGGVQGFLTLRLSFKRFFRPSTIAPYIIIPNTITMYMYIAMSLHTKWNLHMAFLLGISWKGICLQSNGLH